MINALDDPPPDPAAAAEKLGITEKELINALGVMPQEMEEAEKRIETIHGVDFKINYPVFTWEELPEDFEKER